MYAGRKQDLSIIYWLKGLFNSLGISIVDGFPQEEFSIPCIAVEWDNIDSYLLQMGSKHRELVRVWYLDVFASSKTQKDEIVYKLLEEIEKENIIVYDYDQGFPPTVVPKLGKLSIASFNAKNIEIFPELTNKLYHRATVSFVTQYEIVGGI